MKPKNETIQMTDNASTGVQAQRRKNLEFKINFLQMKLVDNENALLDIPDRSTTSSGLTDKHRQAVDISNQLTWLSQIMMNRYLVPEEQEKQRLATALKAEDAERLGIPAGGKLIEMP